MRKERGNRQARYQVLILGVLFLILASDRPVQAQTIDVDRAGPIDSISKAIEMSLPGDQIRVQPGVYEGQLIIDKPVELIGVDHPVIDGQGLGDTITIKADGVKLRGFEVRGSGRKIQNSDAGIKIFSSHNEVKENCLKDNLFGIYLNKASQNVLEGNEITGRQAQNKLKEQKDMDVSENAGLHPTFEGESGDGIHLFSASGNRVSNNTIEKTRDGIYFNYAENNQLTGNRISYVRYGIHYMYSNDNIFEENRLTDNTAGAALMYSKNITFKNNVFAHNRGQRSYGLLFSTCDDSLAEGNVIIDNTRGAFFDVSLHNVFKNNLVASNDVGIDLISSSSDNLFVNNNLADNLQQVAMVAGSVGQDNLFAKNGQGNYWNDYSGFDLDRDGIGDIPYLSGDPFTFLMKKAPAVRLFLNSPAASALEFSEKMFPIIDIPMVKDEYPVVEPIPMPNPDLVNEFTAKRTSNKALGLYSVAMLFIAGLIFNRALRISSKKGKVKGFSKRGISRV